MDRGTLIFVSLSFGMALILIGANVWESTQPVEEDDRILEVCLQEHTQDVEFNKLKIIAI